MRKKSRSSFDEGWGLCFGADGRVTWGMDHGWGQSLPHGLKQFICSTINNLTCMVSGHSHIGVILWLAGEDRYDPPVCTYCGTEMKVNGQYVTADQLWRPHWKDVPPIPGVDYPLDLSITAEKTAYDALVAKGVEPWTTEDEPDYANPEDPALSDDSDEPLNS